MLPTMYASFCYCHSDVLDISSGPLHIYASSLLQHIPFPDHEMEGKGTAVEERDGQRREPPQQSLPDTTISVGLLVGLALSVKVKTKIEGMLRVSNSCGVPKDKCCQYHPTLTEHYEPKKPLDPKNLRNLRTTGSRQRPIYSIFL